MRRVSPEPDDRVQAWAEADVIDGSNGNGLDPEEVASLRLSLLNAGWVYVGYVPSPKDAGTGVIAELVPNQEEVIAHGRAEPS